MRTRILAIAIAAGLAVVGAGCAKEETPAPGAGGTTPPAGGQQSDTPDPCTLLTLAEVSAAIGYEFAVSEELPPGGLPGQRTCAYRDNADSVGIVSVAVFPFDPAGVDAFMEQTGYVGQFDGLGDRGFGEAYAMWALKGNLMVNVTFAFVEVDRDNIDPILALTRDAAARLP